jgi:hypothetical protein
MQAQESSRWHAAWKAFWIAFPLCGLAAIAETVPVKPAGFVFVLLQLYSLCIRMPGNLLTMALFPLRGSEYFATVALTLSFCIYFALGYGFFWINRRVLK